MWCKKFFYLDYGTFFYGEKVMHFFAFSIRNTYLALCLHFVTFRAKIRIFVNYWIYVFLVVA